MPALDEVTRDCVSAIIQLRRIDPATVSDPPAVHWRLRGFVEAMIRQSNELGVSQEDTSDIAYAIVALADEVAVGTPGPLQQYWMANLLQLRYFGENLAGENFYHRIEALRAEPRRYDCLKVYYVCLLLGFQGRYRLRAAESERTALLEVVQQDLMRQGVLPRDEVLSPRGARPQSPGSRVRHNLPVLWLSAAAIATTVLVNIVLHLVLASSVREVSERIDVLVHEAGK